MLLEITVEESAGEEILVRSQSDSPLLIECLDGCIGELEYIDHCKSFYKCHVNRSENTIVEEVGEYFLVIAATREACSLILAMPLCEEQIV